MTLWNWISRAECSDAIHGECISDELDRKCPGAEAEQVVVDCAVMGRTSEVQRQSTGVVLSMVDTSHT